MSGEEKKEPISPTGLVISLGDGPLLPVSLMLDKDDQPVEHMKDAVTVLAGSKELGWFEVDVVEGSWDTITFH